MPLTELKKHPHDYLVLVVGVTGILIAFTLSSPSEYRQRACSLVLGGFYTAWGVWHHTRDHSLSKATLVEYLAISIFVTAVLWMAVSY